MNVSYLLELTMLILSFEKSCPPVEVHPQEWNPSLVLKNLRQSLYETLKQALEVMLTCKIIFLVDLASAKRVSEIHGLSYRTLHSLDWSSITCRFSPDFVTKTQNPTLSNNRWYDFDIPTLWREGGTEKKGYFAQYEPWEYTQDIPTTADRPALVFFSWPLIQKKKKKKKKSFKNMISFCHLISNKYITWTHTWHYSTFVRQNYLKNTHTTNGNEFPSPINARSLVS